MKNFSKFQLKNMKKINLAILFGGKSAEHEVSLQSAKNVVDAIDKNKYNLILIAIEKDGRWYKVERQKIFNSTTNSIKNKINQIGDEVFMAPGEKGRIYNISKQKYDLRADVVFPILHGPFGEDGTVQGLLKLAGVPFVGPGVLGSAVGMDKDVMKRLFKEANLPIGKYKSLSREEKPNLKKIIDLIGFPIFVKPANLGSSVGISKTRNIKELKKAIDFAFEFDRKIILEENINGREIECSVLGNEHPIASLPGEIISSHDFYSYEAKYLDKLGAELIIPAKLSKKIIHEVKRLAIEVFKVLGCEGLARVDFFLEKNGKLTVNEINTIPGFTKISMYPKLFEASGISYRELIDRLIMLAIGRFDKEKKLKTSK
jgi:D-alanine-D-alanine ligase